MRTFDRLLFNERRFLVLSESDVSGLIIGEVFLLGASFKCVADPVEECDFTQICLNPAICDPY